MNIILYDSFGRPVISNGDCFKKERELWKIFLCKFPIFDPSWSDEIRARWMSLMNLLWQWGGRIYKID